MAIGTAAAIGLGVAGIGSALSSSSNKKAASKAANVSAQNNTANVALQRDIYNRNANALAPFMQRGNAAGSQVNALLGLGPANDSATMSAANGYGIGDGMAGMGTPAYSGNAQQNAFDTFRNSTGYQFRFGEGMNALNSGYAGAGILQSGDAMRAAQEYGQNFASNEFGNYFNALANQQGIGLSGASALAGVGTNYAGMVTDANNQNAANQANALLYRGQNSFGNTLGMLGGVLTGL